MAADYKKAVENRRAEDARRKVLQDEQAAREMAEREAQEWKKRATAAVYKAEFAYEVLRAVLAELRRGQPVSKPSLQNAWHKLEAIPPEMKAILMGSNTKLDGELRKEEPYKSSE